MDDMKTIIADGTVDATARGRNVALSQLKKPISSFPTSVQESLRRQAFEASEATLRRLTGNALETLASAAEQGLSVDAAAANLNTEFQSMQEFELKRIARTEMNRAQQSATVATEIELGVEFHQWITALDDVVRDTHIDQHGEIVRVGDLFTNGLERPGDPAGPVEEIINCRCRVVPFIPPRGMRAPPELDQFYEDELVEVNNAS